MPPWHWHLLQEIWEDKETTLPLNDWFLFLKIFCSLHYTYHKYIKDIYLTFMYLLKYKLHLSSFLNLSHHSHCAIYILFDTRKPHPTNQSSYQNLTTQWHVVNKSWHSQHFLTIKSTYSLTSHYHLNRCFYSSTQTLTPFLSLSHSHTRTPLIWGPTLHCSGPGTTF